MPRFSAFLLLTCTIFALNRPAYAESREFVISMSGFLGTTEQAAPVLDKLFRRLETNLGWPEKSIQGAYYPDADEGLKQIKQNNPGFAVVTHQIYVQHHKAMKMKVIAGMELLNGALSRFHVVTKKQGGPSSIDELIGKKIVSPHLQETLFAERILLSGKLSLGSGPRAAIAQNARAPLRALRKVHRGRADAAIVDESVVEQLSSLPFGSELQVIHSSQSLPPLPVVALGSSSKADRGPMGKALRSLCNGQEGKALCTSMRLKAVQPASAATFAKITRLLSR